MQFLGRPPSGDASGPANEDSGGLHGFTTDEEEILELVEEDEVIYIAA